MVYLSVQLYQKGVDGLGEGTNIRNVTKKKINYLSDTTFSKSR